MTKRLDFFLKIWFFVFHVIFFVTQNLIGNLVTEVEVYCFSQRSVKKPFERLRLFISWCMWEISLQNQKEHLWQ